jgi:hypothetical protein
VEVEVVVDVDVDVDVDGLGPASTGFASVVAAASGPKPGA